MWREGAYSTLVSVQKCVLLFMAIYNEDVDNNPPLKLVQLLSYLALRLYFITLYVQETMLLIQKKTQTPRARF